MTIYVYTPPSMSKAKGSRGQNVKDVQVRLAEIGYNPGPLDGIFGTLTDAAVRSFQQNHHGLLVGGLTVDGVVGPATGSALTLYSW